MSTIHRTDTGFIQYTKGAPDEVLRRCTSYTENGEILPLTEEKRTAILAENKAMADKALRVLAAAERLYDACPTGRSRRIWSRSCASSACAA